TRLHHRACPTTADRMAAHRKSDQRRVYLCAGGLRKRDFRCAHWRLRKVSHGCRFDLHLMRGSRSQQVISAHHEPLTRSCRGGDVYPFLLGPWPRQPVERFRKQRLGLSLRRLAFRSPPVDRRYIQPRGTRRESHTCPAPPDQRGQPDPPGFHLFSRSDRIASAFRHRRRQQPRQRLWRYPRIFGFCNRWPHRPQVVSGNLDWQSKQSRTPSHRESLQLESQTFRLHQMLPGLILSVPVEHLLCQRATATRSMRHSARLQLQQNSTSPASTPPGFLSPEYTPRSHPHLKLK